jgi:hypothetical protein
MSPFQRWCVDGESKINLERQPRARRANTSAAQYKKQIPDVAVIRSLRTFFQTKFLT